MINNQLRDEIGALNASKGWHDEPRSIAQHCILLHSEVSEIVEDYRGNKKIDEVWYEYALKDGNILKDKRKQLTKLGKPCGIPSELADVVIRALDMAYEYEYDVNNYRIVGSFAYKKDDSFEELIAYVHFVISSMYDENIINPNCIIVICEYISNRYNINLEQQIRDKIEYNKTRPNRHGGKRL